MEISRIYLKDRTGSFALAFPVDTQGVLPTDSQGADLLVAQSLAKAGQGDASAYFDLGVIFSTASHGATSDLIEAHKWFNLAAVAGHDGAQASRADVSEEMTQREIAEAQRRAREWIAATNGRAS